MKDADKFLSFLEFKERFDIKTNFLTYHGVVSCRKSLRNDTKGQYVKNQNLSTFVDNFTKVSKPKRMAYEKLSVLNKKALQKAKRSCVLTAA